MSWLDWLVLVGTLTFITAYGVWRTRGVQDIEAYFRGDQNLRWPTIGLGIMATQASAITFLSTPGQAYDDGMRFVQFYFGLPLAMIVICAVFVPIYDSLKVYTAYEYLEHRFDVRVRYLGACLFLIQRGLAAGITIYAPAIILSSIMGWSLQATNLGIGLVVIAYTVFGGVQAVSQTQKQQMVVMLLGMVIALVVIILRLPEQVSLVQAIKLAGALDRMNPVSFELDFNSRYNFWSGIAGGFFLALSYFGTDQSQVQRYLSGKSRTEIRLGLLFNGMFKVPMQCMILFSGVMVFVFYLFTMPPLFFNQSVVTQLAGTSKAHEFADLTQRYAQAHSEQRSAALAYLSALETRSEPDHAKQTLRDAATKVQAVRKSAKSVIAEALPEAELNDTDYVFLGFVMKYLPRGLIGLLIAVILCAAMSSTSSELAALGSTSTLDLYQRLLGKALPKERGLLVSKLFTALWGGVAVSFAAFAALLDNLIEAVNILGSLFYGTVLGMFLVGFFMRWIRATPVLFGALLAQLGVLAVFSMSKLGFLWYNVIGSIAVVVLAAVFQFLMGSAARDA